MPKSSPYLVIALPKAKERTYFTLRFLQEPKEWVTPNGWKHFYAQVRLLKPAGKYRPGIYTFDLVKVDLQRRVLSRRPLTGKTFVIANTGWVHGHGRPFYGFLVKRVKS